MKGIFRWLLIVTMLVMAVGLVPLTEATTNVQVTTTPSATIRVPQNIEAYKIEIDSDGIYELTYAELAAAGMPVATVNPHTLEMMTRGQSVAYQFNGNGNTTFEPHESILFYGWAFDGPRLEAQFVTNNVFWLWADGAGTKIDSVANVTNGTVVESVSAEIHTQPENYFSTTYTNKWTDTPNEFDAWYWEKITKSNALPKTANYTVDLPHVAPRTEPALLTVEVVSQSPIDNHIVSATLNNSAPSSHTWDEKTNVNITGTVPHNLLTSGSNTVAFSIETAAADSILLNRISVAYQRALVADNDTLQFRYGQAGNHTFLIDQISAANVNNVLAWNISDRHQPHSIALTAADIAPSGTQYQYRVGANTSADAAFIVTTRATLHTALAISSYTANDLDPANGADWVAVTHELFSAETIRLATHRANRSQLTTHIVDVEDVINQYGFGLPMPHGIRDYLVHAMQDWATAPRYVLLVGDATINPRQQDCPDCSRWSAEDINYVPTFLEPYDRELGLVPTDHAYSALIGNDDLPDVSIGRLPASSAAGAAAHINKIIQFEDNLASAEDYQKNLLFVSDNTDAAGNFCGRNRVHAESFSAEYNKTELCLEGPYNKDEYSGISVNDVRNEMFDSINDGVLMLTYLGHGFIDGWSSEGILSAADTTRFNNADKPYVQISGNCLDGNFAWPGLTSISETLLELETGGAAAHWGATGLGYLYEHKILHEAMYEGLFEHGHTAIGDAIRYSKESYLNTWYYSGQAYSSTLLGDPAMQLMQPEVAVTHRAAEHAVMPGETIHFEIEIVNQGNYPTQINLRDVVSDGIDIVNAVVPLSVASTTTQTQPATNEITLQFDTPLQPGEKLIIGIEAVVTDANLLGSTIAGTVTVTGSARDANPLNDSGTVLVGVGLFAPTAVKLSAGMARSSSSMPVATSAILLMLSTSMLTWDIRFRAQAIIAKFSKRPG